MTSLSLLIVEDDAVLRDQLQQQLTAFGHTAVAAGDAQRAMEAIANHRFDAVVLDRMLPGLDGVTLLERMRAADLHVPVLMLTALGQSSEKVEGLNAGADDYAVKPIDPEELNARLQALARARGWAPTASDTLTVGEFTISPTRHRVWRNGVSLDLPRTEFKLITELARHAGTVMTRSMLIERVWHYDVEPTTNIVDAYIRRLRVHLTADGAIDPIVTVRGVGYMMRDD
ncbi:response regulator transcription factor [Sphingomonas endophytica]|uniref:XRE family transcriptional regulator n=1 Tax=Sphingomonas endophytica TaxID=869719 RepID=A0A147I572_9SPHN|nr:response regulator transcription factor [Sphingomonas endophytica]KTT73768.1 XRE family transcriptional regulator [Sphingomonas endophytica]